MRGYGFKRNFRIDIFDSSSRTGEGVGVNSKLSGDAFINAHYMLGGIIVWLAGVSFQ